jgi:hypothetical protein
MAPSILMRAPPLNMGMVIEDDPPWPPNSTWVIACY